MRSHSGLLKDLQNRDWIDVSTLVSTGVENIRSGRPLDVLCYGAPSGGGLPVRSFSTAEKRPRSDRETDIPAKPAQAKQDPRVSEADEHEGGPGDPLAAPREGPHAPLRLIAVDLEHDATRVRRRRISRSGDFDAVYRRGRSVANRHIVMYTFQRGGSDGGARLGLSVSRKVGGAVERSRVKRVLREQFAGIASRFGPTTDVVLIARPGVAEYIETHGSVAIGARLRELSDRLASTQDGSPA